jgi:hypothetical protein
MNYPTRKFLGFTWVGWLNILLVQWFCARLQGCIDDEDGKTTWFIITPVAPLTGWKTNYWPKKRKMFKI